MKRFLLLFACLLFFVSFPTQAAEEDEINTLVEIGLVKGIDGDVEPQKNFYTCTRSYNDY